MADHDQVGAGANGLEVLMQLDPFQGRFGRDLNDNLSSDRGVWKELPFIAAEINGNSKLTFSHLSDQTLHESPS
jgi:hypothetical protein